MPEHANIVRVATVHSQPGREAELIEVARRHAQRLSQREGCFGAQVARSDKRPETISVISRWRDEGALNAYYQSSEFIEERNEALPLVTDERMVEHFQTL